LQTAQAAGEGVDAVGQAFDDEGDDGHGTLVEGQPLPTEDNVGKFRNDLIDFCGPGAVEYEYGDCSYSLLHQVLGFWVRRILRVVFGCKDTKIFGISNNVEEKKLNYQ